MLRAVVGVLALGVLIASWIGSISDTEITGDAWHTLRMGFNLANQGVVSRTNPCGEETSCPDAVIASYPVAVPTNYREPVPAVVLAGWFKILEAVHGPLSFAFLQQGPGIRLVKLSNIFWALVLSLSVFGALLALTQTYLVAVLGALFVGLRLSADKAYVKVDTLFTEPAAAALLALSSLLALLAVRTGKGRYYLLAGVSFALLTLTKAVFFYVCLGLIVLFAVLAVWRGGRGLTASGIDISVMRVAAFLIGLVIVLGPWMARNYYYFGSAQVSQRAGVILMMRANYDQMSWTEYKGTFYAWAHSRAVREFIGRVLGFNEEDLKKGGRLQRLTDTHNEFREAEKRAEARAAPEEAITYYSKARAERRKIERDFASQGNPNFESAADAELQRRAIGRILSDPIRHVLLTGPFLWRGSYFIGPVLVLFAVIAVWRRRLDLLTYAAPALGMVVLYAVATQNLLRFNAVADPIAIVCLIALTCSLVLWLFQRSSD